MKRYPSMLKCRMIVMLISSAFCSQPLLFAGAAPDQQAYVVTVRPDASIDGIGVIARQMAASCGGTLVEGAGGGEDSFVIRVSESRARVLSADPRVKSVVPMRFTPEPQTAVETVPWSSGVAYSYDGTGNITQIGNDVYSYDGLNRLVRATVNSVNRTYQYDAHGNRTACTQFAPNDCQAFTINTAENKNRIAGAEYDKNDPAGAGNVTGLSGHVYSYDPLNMMTRDSFGPLYREFVYTADDERIATYTGSSWSWTVRGTDERVLREFTSNDGPAGPGTASWQWTKDYVWRDGLLLASRQPNGTNTTTYHYHLDHLGTPRRVTDQNDRIVGVHDYYAFGIEPSGGTAEPSATTLKYTGHERDDWSGSSDALDYMHARYYSPWLGRFLSVDPVLGDPAQPQTWNRYAYVHNRPVNLTDPTGRCTFIPCINYGKGAFEIAEEITVTGEAPPDTYTFQEQFITEVDIQLGEQMRTDWANTRAGRAEYSGAPNIAANGGEFLIVAPFTGMLRGVGADVLSSTGSRVFWSGSQGAREAAESFAQANGATTLEMTPAGQALTQATAAAGWETTQGAWAAASRSFAEGASGDVTVFQAATGLRVGGMWATQEYPLLVSNTSVTGIRYMIVYPNGTVIPVP